jgi:Amt family ammonium transporter
VKCGEERPVCKRCFNLRLSCEWGVPVKRGKSVTPARHLQPRWSSRDIAAAAPAASSTEINFPATSWYPIEGIPDLTAFSFGSLPSPGWAGVSPYPPPPPLYSSLSGTDFACANSLMLSDHDQKYFQYFPSSSVVFYYMKSWQWSSFCYLYQGPAVTNKVIMRMILALSASDMHRNGLMVRSPGRPTADDHGRYHYGLAVKEFRQSLVSPRTVSSAELETILATMFLMITYEWQYGHCVRHLQLHLQGVKSLLESHPELFQIKDVNNVLLSMKADSPDESGSRVSFIPEQLLLWIL